MMKPGCRRIWFELEVETGRTEPNPGGHEAGCEEDQSIGRGEQEPRAEFANCDLLH